MSSRQNILDAVKENQPKLTPLPEVPQIAPYFPDLKEKFVAILQDIGPTVHFVRDYVDINRLIREQFPGDVLFANTLPERVLPFIPQHLAAVLHSDQLVATMHDAYRVIGPDSYGWGAFIAGPSKTADIEQSLVLGAHGPRTMTLFILES